MLKAKTIAIDGPVASGKTVVGLRLARRLGYRFVDTGVMYRAVTWQALRQGIPLDDEEALAGLASSMAIDVREPEDGALPRLWVDGRDLTQEVRRPEVDRAVSQVSKAPGVRQAMVRLQRQMGREGRVVMVGRDIGTVVLPDAPLKVFLLASAEERARRRHQERVERGEASDYQQVLEDLRARDRQDTERDISPLKPAPDARQVVTDDLTVDQVVNELWRLTAKP